jgi:hypothetical protein
MDAASCPHDNGTGQSYYDCAPLGQWGNGATYSATMAAEAAAAWLNLKQTTVSCPDSLGVSQMCVEAAALTTGYPCGIWCYTGSLAGRVYAGLGQCTCPQEGWAGWD